MNASIPAATPAVRRESLTAPLCAAAAAGAASAVAIGFAAGADAVESWQLAARYTARFAFLLFLPVYVASAWHRLAPSAASRWMLQRRRSLGLAFSSAHATHLAALTTFQLTKGAVPDAGTLVFGGGAYVALAALAATSNDAAVRRLGRNWRRLHRFGVHYLWFIFAFSYFGRVAAGRLAYLPLLGAALVALGLRIFAWQRRQPRSARAAASARA